MFNINHQGGYKLYNRKLYKNCFRFIIYLIFLRIYNLFFYLILNRFNLYNYYFNLFRLLYMLFLMSINPYHLKLLDEKI